ncbi:MAG: RNA polymerase subunit sigma-70 [Acidobacteria bacterium]|nr:MAG: RNA polymerase subunit sigma-70 [Acidobacteriota bacterium]
MTRPPHEVTELLVAWSEGDRAALDQLTPLVYEELHRLARNHMSRERQGHTLQTSALVNEAYLRLIDQKNVRWQNRAQFFSIASRLMRRILVDHARSHRYAKRGGDIRRVSLDEAAVLAQESAAELVALDDALKSLAALDPRKCQVVELRFFGGMSVEESAEVLGVSVVTVMRDWSTAKAWLQRAMEKEVSEKG